MTASFPQRTGSYQFVILGSQGDAQLADHSRRLNSAVTLALTQLGVNSKKFLTQLGSGSNASALDRRMPSVAVFFGMVASPVLSSVDRDRLKHLLDDGVLIIPVVARITRFTEFVPPEIAHLNGISVTECGADFERLASRILEGLGLLRETRRLFISYRRNETSGVAAQLYEALDAAGFDVFLDTHGVLRPGEPFQDITWHRLADTDVTVVLDSPGFMATRWTEEELARVNASNIQVLQVLWPGEDETAPAAFSTFQPLEKEDFAGRKTLGQAARLRPGAVGAIIDNVESLRARAIGARHAYLIREFMLEARSAGLAVRTNLNKAIIVSRPGREALLVLPAVGVPDAARYHGLETLYRDESTKGRKYAAPPILLYDQTGIRAMWLDHLKWLNGNLTCVRSLSLIEARDWLSSL